MHYSLGREQVDKLLKMRLMPEFLGAEMLMVSFETDPTIVSQILPKPLSLGRGGRAVAFVAKYPETNFGCVYNEGALLVGCDFKGEQGFYCLSMPVNDDMALIAGREHFGYPKKIAESITLEREGDRVTGSVIRKGTEIMRIECRLSGEAPETYMGDLAVPVVDWNGQECQKVIVYLFKYFPSPRGRGFDYLPRLVREPVLFRHNEWPKAGVGSVKLGVSPVDPLGELPVGQIANMFYGEFNNTMLPGRVVARAWDPMRFARHAFFKTDMAVTLLEQPDFKDSERTKNAWNLARRM
jgi:acetoacetate decarboxylase